MTKNKEMREILEKRAYELEENAITNLITGCADLLQYMDTEDLKEYKEVQKMLGELSE